MRNFWSAVVPGLLFAQFAIGQGVGPHVSGGHLAGSAAGLDDGYSEANAFVPLWQPNRDSLLFADASFLMFNDGSDFLGGNVGGGVRRWQDFSNSIVGVYGYYDRRELNVTAFDQYGLGIESLGYIWDARLNLNVPIGAATFSQTSAPGFIGDGFGTRTSSIHGLTVLDAEVGAVLWANDSWQFRSFVGAYGLFDNIVQDTAGARGRVEARINDQCWIGGFIEHDRQFDTTGGATFTWRFGRGKKACNNSGYNVMARLGDPVQRRKHVAVGKSERATLATIQGESIRIAHFVPGGDGLTGQSVTPSGDGSVEKPYNSLAFVENSTADIVYIHPGVYEGASIRVTRAGQRVIAGSQLVGFNLNGQWISPTPMTGEAIISGSPGDAITIAAHRVTVSGFHIVSAGRHGIYADMTMETELSRNTISGSAEDGIHLNSLYGTGYVQQNVSIVNGGSGIRTHFFYGDITENITNYNTEYGILVDAEMGGALRGNDAIENGADGIRIVSNFIGSPILIHTISENETSRNGGDGIHVGGVVRTDSPNQVLHDNYSTENNGNGILVEGEVIGSVHNNVTNGNSDNGLLIAGDVAGYVGYNVAQNNGITGIAIGGNSGSVASNLASQNLQNGIQIDGDVVGAVDANESEENGLKGITILGNVGQTLYENRVNRNGDEGIVVGGTVGGPVSYNIVGGNGGDGLAVNGSVGGDLILNVFDDNQGYGAAIQGNVGNLFQNRFTHNDADGLFVLGGVSGPVIDNAFDSNAQSGLVVMGNVAPFSGQPSFSQNTASDNAADGIKVHGNVTGDVIDNITDNNGDDGIDIDGVVSGATAPNFATGNGDQAFEN